MKSIFIPTKCITAIAVAVFLFSFMPTGARAGQNDCIPDESRRLQFGALEYADMLESAVFADKDLLDAYAGVFIDDDGILVISFVPSEDNGTLLKYKAIMQNCNVRFREAKNNLKTLENSYDILVNRLGQYGIQSVGIEFRRNAVIVTVEDRSQQDAFLKDLDASSVIIEDVVLGLVPTLTTDIANGKPGATSRLRWPRFYGRVPGERQFDR